MAQLPYRVLRACPDCHHAAVGTGYAAERPNGRPRACRYRRADRCPPIPLLTLRLCRTAGVPNFFALANRYSGSLSHLNYLMPAAMLMAIAAAGTSMLLGGSLLHDALPRCTAAYLACCPVPSCCRLSCRLRSGTVR